MKTLLILFLTLLSLTLVNGQEKKIRKAIEALNENNFEECFKQINEYTSQAPSVPLATYVEYLAHVKQGSPSYDLEKGFKKIQIVSQWMQANSTEKSWCKSYGLCFENITSQIDYLALNALRKVESNKSDQAYQNFIQTYSNTPINKKGIESYHHWKFEDAMSANSVARLESFIKQFPDASDVDTVKKKIEEMEYNKCSSSNEIPMIEAFLKKYPNSIYTAKLKNKIKEIDDFTNAKKSGNKESLESFIRDYPNSKYLEEAKKKLDELVNGVLITCSGQGNTLEEAKQSALRSAIEQIFGAFISSKTEIFNDVLVVDQMASVSSGNIKSYEVLNESQLPDGSWGVTLKTIVSVDKLTSFVEAKGIAIEIKGGMFALNIKQQLLNEQGEIKAVSEMVGLLHEPMQISFDYVIKSSDPKSLDAESKNWEIPLIVTATTNKNMDFCANYCIKTLAALSLSPEEVTSYKSLNKTVFPVVIKYKGETKTFYLRKQSSINALNTLTSQWEFYTRLFTVQSGMDESNGNGKIQIHEFSGSQNYENKAKTINFLTTGWQAATFSWQDKRTLAQIEQMTSYTVKPKGVVSQFKHGGFVVYEENGHGLVAAITDLGEMDWNAAKTACDELVINGYSDWHLPTREELNILYFYLRQNEVGDFKNGEYDSDYWSSTESNSGDAWFQNFRNGIRGYYEGNGKDSRYYVRAVRAFSIAQTQTSQKVIKEYKTEEEFGFEKYSNFNTLKLNTKGILDVNSNHFTKTYKTLVSAYYKDATVNFAQKYTIIWWEAGMGTAQGTIIDYFNGKAYDIPIHEAYYACFIENNQKKFDKYFDGSRVFFRKDSNLLVLRSCEEYGKSENENGIIYKFYIWDEKFKKFTLLKIERNVF